jgi:negative regulator of replication initiation
MRGPTPTSVTFKSISRDFHTAKEAYVWLLRQFINFQPHLFEESLRLDLAKGRARHYFGRDPKGLFNTSPHLGENSNYYELIDKGWYAITNLNNEEKRQILFTLSAIGGLS